MTTGCELERFDFRIRRSGKRWVVQTYYAEPPYTGWQPLVSGFESEDQARSEFSAMYASQDLRWTDARAGSFRSFPNPAGAQA